MSHLLPFFTIYNTYFFFIIIIFVLYHTYFTICFYFFFFFSLPYIRYLSYFHSPSHCAPDIGLEFSRFV